MTCENCRQETDGLIGGFAAQAGAAWCLACVRAAGINVPHVLTMRYAGDGTNDRAAWLAQKAADKRAKLEAFLASRRAKNQPAPGPALVMHTAGRIGEQMGFSL